MKPGAPWVTSGLFQYASEFVVPWSGVDAV